MTVAVEIRFGTGKYAAAEVTQPDTPEWPPHPVRLAAAMVAAMGNPEPGDSATDTADALEWLFRQGPPTITAPTVRTGVRNAVQLFVPVNDEASLADERSRHPRLSTPSTYVGNETVVFEWPDSSPTCQQRDVLSSALSRVTRIGHSSSFVACRLIDDPPEPTWVPVNGSAGSSFSARVAYDGFRADADLRYDTQQRTRTRSLPLDHELVHYGRPEPDHIPEAVSDLADADWIILEVVNRATRRVSSTATPYLTMALRAALLRYIDDPAPHVLTGKTASGRPTTQPHALFLALPSVGHRHADGMIKGLAIVIPAEVPESEKHQVFHAINNWEASGDGRMHLTVGKRGDYLLQDIAPTPLGVGMLTLNPKVWSRSSRWWASVTALSLAREPHKLYSSRPSDQRRAWRQAELFVRKSCAWSGLPDPISLEVGFAPPILGGAHISSYSRFGQGTTRRPQFRTLLHAEIDFGVPVKGPIVLGTGRFRGLGLMWPLDIPRKANGKGGLIK